MKNLLIVIDFIKNLKQANPDADKASVEEAVVVKFSPSKNRSLYVWTDFVMRFSEAKKSGFSNTVLSLSALKMYDHLPVIVCLVRKTSVEFFLANSTLIKKISHSSHSLSLDNIKGSFNGSDIEKEIEGIKNDPSNFDELFEMHKLIDWEANLKRIIALTEAIKPVGIKFSPSKEEKENILRAAEIAAKLSSDDEYSHIQDLLQSRVSALSKQIAEAASINNVNLRGNAIEQIITNGINAHSLEDTSFALSDGKTLFIDIKTKLINKNSAPKAYNVDKTLRLLATGTAAISFFMIGIEPTSGRIQTKLISILDKNVIDMTAVQPHWAGRNSRGATQLQGKIGELLSEEYSETIDSKKAESFLEELVDL